MNQPASKQCPALLYMDWNLGLLGKVKNRARTKGSSIKLATHDSRTKGPPLSLLSRISPAIHLSNQRATLFSTNGKRSLGPSNEGKEYITWLKA